MVSAESIKSSRLQQTNSPNNSNITSNGISSSISINSISSSKNNSNNSNNNSHNNQQTINNNNGGNTYTMANNNDLLFEDEEAGDITNTFPAAAQIYTADIRVDLGVSPNVATPLAELVDKRSLLTFSKSLNSTNSQAIYSPIWRSPRFLKHRNTIMAAVGLFLIGISFIAVAIYIFGALGSKTVATIFLIIGILTVLPGGYQTIYIYKALKGVPGYNFSGIPSFD